MTLLFCSIDTFDAQFQIAIVLTVLACAYAKPAPEFITPLGSYVATAPLASSAIVSREYHGNAAPLLAAYAYSSPYVVSPAAYSAAYAAPVLY